MKNKLKDILQIIIIVLTQITYYIMNLIALLLTVSAITIGMMLEHLAEQLQNAMTDLFSNDKDIQV